MESYKIEYSGVANFTKARVFKTKYIPASSAIEAEKKFRDNKIDLCILYSLSDITVINVSQIY